MFLKPSRSFFLRNVDQSPIRCDFVMSRWRRAAQWPSCLRHCFCERKKKNHLAGQPINRCDQKIDGRRRGERSGRVVKGTAFVRGKSQKLKLKQFIKCND